MCLLMLHYLLKTCVVLSTFQALPVSFRLALALLQREEAEASRGNATFPGDTGTEFIMRLESDCSDADPPPRTLRMVAGIIVIMAAGTCVTVIIPPSENSM